MAKHWRIFIDWDGDEIAETGEHGLTFSYSAQRGRERMLKNDGLGFEAQRIGRAVIELYNDDRRFDPYYSSSPLYGLLSPDRKIEIGVEEGGTDLLLLESGDALLQESGDFLYLSDGDYHARFTGRIDDIQPATRNVNRTVRITILDDWRRMRNESGLRIDVISATDTATAIGAILDEIGWSDADRDINGAGDDIDYFWSESKTADDELWRLVESNLGQVFFSNDGKFTFYARHELYNTTEDITITEADLGKDIETPYEWRSIKNKVVVKAHPVLERTAIELWRLVDIPLVKAGESLEIWASLVYENRPIVATAITNPVATTDYTANSLSSGGGSNLTANISITVDKLGRTAKITITNSGATDAYMTLLKLRGDALDSPTVTEYEATASTRITKSSLDLDLLWIQSTNVARDFALWLLSWLENPLIFPTVTLDDQDTLTLPTDLGTRVRADLDTLEIDTDFYVSKIDERWLSENGQHFAVSWSLEPVDMTQYWEFTTSLGVSSRFAF